MGAKKIRICVEYIIKLIGPHKTCKFQEGFIRAPIFFQKYNPIDYRISNAAGMALRGLGAHTSILIAD